MPTPRRLITLALPLAGLACVGAHEPSPAEPAPSGPPTVEAPGRAVDGPLTLHPVAAREGDLDLTWVGERAYLMLDGEPIPLEPGRPPARVAALGRGLQVRESFMGGPGVMTVALGGRLDQGQGYLTTREDFERAGSRFDTYALSGDGWRPSKLGQGQLQGYYQSLITLPDGALLGLRAFEFEFGEMPEVAYEDSDESAAFWADVDAQRRAAPSGFEVLAGRVAAVPQLPSGWQTTDATATTAGQIVAIAYQPDPKAPYETGPTRILSWAPGATAPEIQALPELEDTTQAYSVSLWPAGDRVVATAYQDRGEQGYGPYLAVGDGQSWQPIPVELPGLEPNESAISSATLGPDGQPWITLGSWYDPARAPNTTLWRYDAGAWLAVELPPVGPEVWAQGPRWVRDVGQQRWFERPLGAPSAEPPPSPTASAVVWAGETVWVVARAGRAYPESEELYAPDPRTIVYASEPLAELAPALLPGFDVVLRERVDLQVQASKPSPGGPGCHEFTLVAVDRPSTHASARDQVVAKLRALTALPETNQAWVSAAFIGAPIDAPGHDQLVLQADTWQPADAVALEAEVERALGVPVSVDCRPREVVQMLRQRD